MILDFSKKFRKRLVKHSEAVQKRLEQRIGLFLTDPFHPILRNHLLQGTFDGYRSINITGDIRAVFKQGERTILFVDIGTHSELYG